MFPEGGAEYDAKVKVSNLNEENRYRLEIPKKLKNTGSVKIYLGYVKSSGGATRYLQYDKKLRYWFEGEVVDIEFTAPPKEGYKPYIHVLWPGEVCDIIANSKNLDNIN